MKSQTLLQLIYLYLFSALGLVLLTIGMVRFLDMALKVLVFTQAEVEYFSKTPPPVYYPVEKIQSLSQNESLSLQEKQFLQQWMKDYQAWIKERSQINPVVSRRHREASLNISMILVGGLLYLYHWRIIRRELFAAS